MTTHPNPWSWRTTASVAGLVVGILGIVLQYVGDESLFGGFPPGIYFLAAAIVLVVATRRWAWAPVFAVLLAAWITMGGIVGGQLGDNITSGRLLVAAGAIVLQLGLTVSIVAGVVAIVHNTRDRKRQRELTDVAA